MTRIVTVHRWLATAWIVSAVAVHAGAPTTGASQPVQCGLVSQPAATVLLPYFEVDLEEPGGRATLFSVGNVSAEPVLAHAVVWTNWSQPVLSFDFSIPGEGVRAFDVRSLIRGQLPRTSPPSASMKGPFESCTDPLSVPQVDVGRLTALLTGRPAPDDGLCYSSAVEDGRLATGFVTVDVVDECSGARLTTPRDDGYFVDGGAGVATNENVLWGDFFLVDPANDFAQGEKLATLVADGVRFGEEIVCVTDPCPPRSYPTFYRNQDNRMPLARVHQARFLKGGAFAGETEIVMWTEFQAEPGECGSTADSRTPELLVFATPRNEAGDALEPLGFTALETVFRVPVGGEALPLAANFGSVDLEAVSFTGGFGLEQAVDLQTWMMPLVSASGRYSVGMNAVPVADFCRWSD